VIVHRVEVNPLDLMRARGGSPAAALALTGEGIREMVAKTSPGAHEIRASWVAYISAQAGNLDGLAVIDWDPTTPIPVGCNMLALSVYTAALVSEDRG
jgi:hypothetical protein